MKNTFLFIFFLPFVSFGQINRTTNSPDIMPNNPQEAQFIKYGEIPVDEYTGTPDIKIPVYNLKTKAFDIPIELTYHASGNKVNEEASWVGLGWNLNADMQIVQTVVGLDDYGHYRYPILPDFDCMVRLQSGGTSGSTAMANCGTFFLGITDNWNQDHADCYFQENFKNGVWDSLPDIFYFNAMGYSGKFVMDWTNGLFKCLTDKNIKIEAPNFVHNSDNPVQEFIITVPDGHTFYFILKDETIIQIADSASEFGGSFQTPVYLTGERSSRTFKLRQVITNKGDVLSFEYQKARTVDSSPTDIVSKNFPNISLTHRTYQASAGSNLNMGFNGAITNYFATSQSYSYLSKITYNDIVIRFISSPRLDLVGSKKLDRIEVVYKNLVVKKFIFSYDYFMGNTDGRNWDNLLHYFNYSTDKNATELTHRLKLNSFQVFDNLQLGEKPYIFTYNPQTLPKKTSYATDYWGYYNGMHDNSSFLPDIYKFNLERENNQYTAYQNNNNAANLNFNKACVLEKIQYPTGGYTQFNYELNTFGNYRAPLISQGQKKSIQIVATGGSSNYQAMISKGGSTIFKGGYLLSTRGCTDANAYSNTYIKIERFKSSLVPLVENNQYGLLYALSLMGILNGTNQSNYNQYIQDVQYIRMNYNDPMEVLVNNYQTIANEGVVIFTVHGGCGVYNGTVNSSQASLTLSYNEYLPLSGESSGGGLRIKNIKDYTDQNSSLPTSNTSYQYEGGKLMSPLLYFNKGNVNHARQFIHFTDGCPLEAQLSISMNEAWNTFVNNPNSYNLANFQSIVDGIGQEGDCSHVVTIDNYFHGVKNELYSGNFSQPSMSASGRYVGYDKVSKKQERTFSTNPNIDNGKVVTSYINNPDIGASTSSTNGYFTDISMPLVSLTPENGKITKQELFDKNSILKKSTSNTYVATEQDCLWGMRCQPTDTYLELVVGTPFSVPESKYLIGVYPIKQGKTLLTKQEITHFEYGQELKEVVNFEYDLKNQLSKKKWIESNGDIVEEQFSYCYDITTGNVSTSMISRNFITPIIQTKMLVNGNPISIKRNPYHFAYAGGFNGAFVIDREMYSKTGNEADLVIMKQYSYDNLGNLIGYSNPNGMNVYIIWGYNKMYPIAIIENAFLTTLQTAPGNLEYQVTNLSNTGSEEDLLSALENLRNTPVLKNSMVTTMTYKPLIGVTSITDAKGDRIYYIYDGLGRLVSSKDKNKKMLTETEYNFRP